MNLKKLIAPAAVAALALGSSGRVDAQDRNRDNRSHARGDGVRSGDQRQNQGSDRGVARNNAVRRDDNVRPSQGWQAPARDIAPRPDNRRGAVQDRRFDGQRYEDRRSFENRGHSVEPRGYAPPFARGVPRYERIEPYRVYTPRPYRSGFSIGIFFGRPFPYRSTYPVPVYGYPTVTPGDAYGGISFAIDPGDADVYVDSQYVGNARDFSGAAQPLTLRAGTHRIELQAPGYEPTVFDANIAPGQVIPFEGGMQPRY